MKKQILLFLSVLVISTGLHAQSWTAQNAGFLKTAVNVEKISIVDKNIVWCVSGSSSPTHEFAVSTDGGATFKKGTIKEMGAKQYFSGIAAVSDKIAYVSVYANPAAAGAVLKTIDGGATWVQQGVGTVFAGASSFPNAIYFWDAMNGLVFGDPINNVNEIYTTTDGGNTWNRTPNANIPPNENLNNGTYYNYDPLVVKGNTVWFPTVNGFLYKSTNRGLSWKKSNIDSTLQIYGISFLDDKLTGLAVASNGLMYKSTDGGDTWDIYAPIGPSPTNVLTSIPGTNIFVAANSNSSVKSSYSKDKGVNWVAIDADNQYYGLAFKDIYTGYAGGNPRTTGGIYKWNPQVLSIKDESPLSQCKLYPNPVSGKLLIDLSKTEFTSATITLSNIQGQKIKVLKCTDKFSEMEIGEPNGVYFITISSANEQFTQRIVVNKD
ncbi:MAG: T9SS type A sorting domain-containing protein [Saprospiraceae bacterium]